jgi:cell division initiation protein
MTLTPLDIEQQQFRIKFRGFDVREVDIFLEEMAIAFSSLIQEQNRLKKELEFRKRENQKQKERETTFEQAITSSQKVVEQLRENAKKSAEIIIADAEVKAEKMLNRAHNRLAQLHEDIAELKRQRIQIEVQIRSILETHTKILEMGKADTRAMDEEDAKLKVLKQSHPFI